MREFFKHWHRKVGVATLILACAFTAAWVRSLSEYNGVKRYEFENAFLLGSKCGRITGIWLQERSDFPETILESRPLTDLPFNPMDGSIPLWRWDPCGFHVGIGIVFLKEPAITIAVPYWSIVFPLILVATCLLLSKLRPGKTAESPCRLGMTLRNFFKGWRRKAGVATLGLAAVLAAVWVRSLFYGDEIQFTLFQRTQNLGWESGNLSWWSWPARAPNIPQAHHKSWTPRAGTAWPGRNMVFSRWQSDKDNRQLVKRLEERARERRSERESKLFKTFPKIPENLSHELDLLDKDIETTLRGLVYVTNRPKTAIADPRIIQEYDSSFWPIVLSLTLLSACLLIRKPRPAKEA